MKFKSGWNAMALMVLLVVGGLLVPPFASAEAQKTQKISPDLEQLLSQSPDQLKSRGAAIKQTPKGEVMIRIIMESTCPEADMTAAGLVISSKIDNYYTGAAGPAAIRALGAMPCVAYIEPARQMKPRLELAVPSLKADRVRSGAYGNYTGFTGKNVVFGVVDTGIDTTHPDFKDANGSRILYLWDQAQDGVPPADYTYGTEYTKADVDAGKCLEKDIQGHGTHVTGIAAGNGQGTGNGYPAGRYVGVAPEAGLVIVKADNLGWFYTDQIIDGLVYIRNKAKALGQPCVVNLSLGMDYGPHDGTSIFEKTIDNMFGPGFLVVAAAGNSGNNDGSLIWTHAEGSLTTVGQKDPVVINIPGGCRSQGSQNDFAVLDLWYNGNDNIRVTVVTPNGFSTTACTGQENDPLTRDTQDAFIYINNALNGVNPQNFDNEALIQILDYHEKNDAGAWMPIGGNYTITLSAENIGTGSTYQSKPYDLWIADQSICNKYSVSISSANRTNQKLVGAPGSSLKILTAGAAWNRNTWMLEGGATQQTTDPVGQLCNFSSPGPTRDGRKKPDLAGLGGNVISTLSKEARVRYPITAIVEDGVHTVMAGTSMSSPMLAGITALMLQNHPDTTVDRVRDALNKTASKYAGGWDKGWGYGVPNVLSAMSVDPPAAPTNLVVKCEIVQQLHLWWSDTNPSASNFIIERADVQAGPYVQIVKLPKGTTEYIDKDLPSNQTFYYRIKATFGDMPSLYSAPVSGQAQDWKSSGGGGGGCFIATAAFGKKVK
ncbi:MAG: S8 family serine peptidase [Deltaproteobacteria bacterium]|nr:S8 family serine peptidase [Deltaproteobacteria bacterium]